MDLQKELKKFITDNHLFSKRDKVLLAVSGGVDSVVMAELFHRAGYNFSIAHCNFKLRGKESDGDEAFVKGLAKKLKIPFFVRKFDTEAYAAKNKLSIQEAARDLRYEWFYSLLKNEKYDRIATAHHFNDNVETFFVNLLRGTGLAGLRGIQSKSRNSTLIRPLLFALKADIEAFAKTERLHFRSDSSNNTDDYLRNRIRHHLIPLLTDLNPQFETVMQHNIRKIEFAESVFTRVIREVGDDYLHFNGSHGHFERSELKQLEFPVGMINHLLSGFGFNYSQAEDIWATTKSGKQFFSKDFVVTIDRDKILLHQIYKKNKSEIIVDADLKFVKEQHFTLGIKLTSKEENIPADSNIHCLDSGKLKFPLVVRKWKAGDFFYPLGMKQKKKISDFLIDKKISRPEKEKTYVIASGKDVACILGHRIDNRYKITDETKKVYRIEYLRT